MNESLSRIVENTESFLEDFTCKYDHQEKKIQNDKLQLVSLATSTLVNMKRYKINVASSQSEEKSMNQVSYNFEKIKKAQLSDCGCLTSEDFDKIVNMKIKVS